MPARQQGKGPGYPEGVVFTVSCWPGDNEEISKRFMVLQIEHEAAGFIRNGSGTGDSPHRLFIS